MQRRRFLQLLAALPAARLAAAEETGAHVMTVRGPVPAGARGLSLPHEHVLVDFIGADRVSPERYAAAAVVAAAQPHLVRAHALGVRALFECTPAWLGRDPRLLLRLSEATGLHLITNTGLYGARRNRFLPPYAHAETAAQLAARWIAEARDGLDGTAVRPGFIKSGVDPAAELSPVHRKLVVAAARAHLATGLTIAVHTGAGPGLAQLELLRAHGVAAGAFVWVHAQHAPDDALFAAAARGAWLSCDGLAPASLPRHLHLCRELKHRGRLGRLLLSHDAGWFDPAQPGGGPFRPYDLLCTAFLPLLRAEGFTPGEIDRVLVANPAAAFTVRVRPAA